MYGLDVNFLKERTADQKNSSDKKRKAPATPGDLTPLYIGGAIAAFTLALVGTGWWFLQAKNGELEQNIAQLEQENQKLEAEIGNINKIRAEITQVKSETQALVTVFDQIRPWSAMLQDVRDRIPATVQLDAVKQIALPAPEGSAPAPANNAGAIEIAGFARTFNDVNDFLVSLQQSRFLKSNEIRIGSAELVDAPLAPGVNLAPGVKPPQVVKYTIQSNVSEVPASELMRELEQKGTVGLVTRIRSLQQTGALPR
ncbi:PilN domain-containing protein [Calothrix sp. UHCC 0171]|uniref:PilN domain-containing protein n=1 Tax=Calothrix sp. UHCC 0171 TaxID=3110245 RepID=UPI002B1FAD9F|nr:PilN domain-containing protein [Calothrix sp. UHCC 0171]MEA5571068.1 PilN domain-containing protein [Calothrix sp. UHCC 0171]